MPGETNTPFYPDRRLQIVGFAGFIGGAALAFCADRYGLPVIDGKTPTAISEGVGVGLMLLGAPTFLTNTEL